MLGALTNLNDRLKLKFKKRVGLRKRIYTIITESFILTDKRDVHLVFSRGFPIEKALIDLLGAYGKSYNLADNVLKDICLETIHIINDLCYTINEQTAYCGNFYNDIDNRAFVQAVLERSHKE